MLQVESEPRGDPQFQRAVAAEFLGPGLRGQIGADDRAPFRLEPRQHAAAAARDDRSRDARGGVADRAQPGPALALAGASGYLSGRAIPISTVHARNPIEPRPCSPHRPDPAALLAWYDRHRRDLPWRAAPGQPPDPYRVWLSEIMLQQTTVATVGPYFDQFVARFPDIRALAAASLDEVLHAWQGLGYYARARNLHACAREVVAAHGGGFPDDPALLRALPGIGDYTAAAIAAIAFDRPVAAVDGNVERVVARLFAERTPLPRAKARLRALAASLVPEQRAGDFAQAMMDLGAALCTPRSPRCVLCPWRADCAAAALGIAEDLPVQTEKPERPLRHGVAFWLTRADGAVLLRRRPEQGLLGGMIELPSTDWRETPWDAAEAVTAAPAATDWRALPGTVRHGFTHFRLELGLLAGTTTDPIAGIWAKPAEFKDHAFPTLTRKLVKHALSALRAATRISPRAAAGSAPRACSASGSGRYRARPILRRAVRRCGAGALRPGSAPGGTIRPSVPGHCCCQNESSLTGSL